MAHASTRTSQITLRPAEHRDVPSLTTLLARSFFPVNATVAAALPDTPLMRAWWARVYTEEVQNPACHLWVAHDAGRDDGVVGMAALRRWRAGQRAGGFWTEHAWTADHGEEAWRPSIDCMVEYEGRIMGGEEHFLLELLAVDHECKGGGIGAKLVRRMCEVADEEGLPIFLQSGGASKYYLKLDMGFEIEAEPTWKGYKSCEMVRRPVLRSATSEQGGPTEKRIKGGGNG